MRMRTSASTVRCAEGVIPPVSRVDHNAGNDIAVFGAIPLTASTISSYSVSLDGQSSTTWPARSNLSGGIELKSTLLVRDMARAAFRAHIPTVVPD
jgi:hypothetical protein